MTSISKRPQRRPRNTYRPSRRYKCSNEPTSGKAKLSLWLLQVIGAIRNNNRQTIIYSEEEEDILYSDTNIIEISISKSQPVGQATSSVSKSGDVDNDIKSFPEDAEAEISKYHAHKTIGCFYRALEQKVGLTCLCLF